MGLIRWLRRRRLPAGLRPALASEERVLAWAPVDSTGAAGHGFDGAGAGAGSDGAGSDGAGGGDGVVVATNRGIWLPGAAGRIDWHTIHKAAWSGRVLTVTPATEVPGGADRYAVMADARPAAVRLADPQRLPDLVRQRVNRSVAYTSRHELATGGAVRVVARRVSGVDGLRWTVRYEGGADGADPAVAAVTADLVERATAALSRPAAPP